MRLRIVIGLILVATAGIVIVQSHGSAPGGPTIAAQYATWKQRHPRYDCTRTQLLRYYATYSCTQNRPGSTVAASILFFAPDAPRSLPESPVARD